eukprot:TRINITY_DN7668_c0_g2_i1.p1 TRINITY_DN7668_c0_g2~~TRINITY_DN7668_c0_g2_i1.p1  ORF type:complete len:432 (+),score=129.76 TRINITY_DN7668_c0_g2_i1:103-1398(+)
MADAPQAAAQVAAPSQMQDTMQVAPAQHGAGVDQDPQQMHIQHLGHPHHAHIVTSSDDQNNANMQAMAMNNMAMGNMSGTVHLMMPEAPLSMAGDDVMTGALTAFEEKFPRAKPTLISDGNIEELVNTKLKHSRCWNKHDLDVVLSNAQVREQLDKVPISKQLFGRALAIYQNVHRIPFSQELPFMPTTGRSKHRFICLACERHHGLPSTIRHIGSTMPCAIKNGVPDWRTWRPCPWAIFGADFISRCLRPMKNMKRKISVPQDNLMFEMPQGEAAPLGKQFKGQGLEGVMMQLREIEQNEIQRHQTTLNALAALRNEVITMANPTAVSMQSIQTFPPGQHMTVVTSVNNGAMSYVPMPQPGQNHGPQPPSDHELRQPGDAGQDQQGQPMPDPGAAQPVQEAAMHQQHVGMEQPDAPPAQQNVHQEAPQHP